MRNFFKINLDRLFIYFKNLAIFKILLYNSGHFQDLDLIPILLFLDLLLSQLNQKYFYLSLSIIMVISEQQPNYPLLKAF